MTVFATAARRAAAAATLTSGVVLLAACGSGSASPGATVTRTPAGTPPASAAGSPSAPVATATAPSGSSPSATAPAGSAPAGAPACATTALRASLGHGNGAAGSTIIPLEFRNASTASCTLFGFPGASFVTGQGGSQIGASALEDHATRRQLITLTPGATAHALMQVAVAQNFPPSRCHLVHAHWLRVFPPGETAPLYVRFSSDTCSARSIQVLAVQTVQTGAGVNS